MKSCTNNAIAVKKDIIYLQISVMKKLDLTDKLSTNSEGVSSWSDLPVRLLADGKLWGQDPYNETAKAGAGYWQSEWNFEVNDDKTKYFDSTYGVYIDINVTDANINHLKIVMKASRGNYPGKAKFYAGTSKDDLTPCLSFENKMPFTKRDVIGYVKDKLKTVNLNYYESDFITVNPGTKIIRLSFLTNASNKSLTDSNSTNNVSLDELELYGY